MTISAPRGRPARSSPRRRNVDTARLQELLVQASDIVLAEGFTSITMDQLAKRLGCSKATLYSLAGTKDQLVQTITRHFFSTAAEEIEQAVAVESSPRNASGPISRVWAMQCGVTPRRSTTTWSATNRQLGSIAEIPKLPPAGSTR